MDETFEMLLPIVADSVFKARDIPCPEALRSFMASGRTQSMVSVTGIDQAAKILGCAFGEQLARRTGGFATAGGFPVAEPAQIPAALRILAAELKAQRDPLDRAGLLGLGLLIIHPLKDGNGRMARMAWCRGLLEAGVPAPAIVSGFRLFHSESGFPAWQCIRAAALGNDQPFLLRWRSAFGG